MKHTKENKGITLIALVITIIVMLILVLVTINVALGDNGLIVKAKRSKYDQNIATEIEKIQTESLGYVTENGEINLQALETAYENKTLEGYTIEYNEGENYATATKGEIVICINKNGNVTKVNSVPQSGEDTNILNSNYILTANYTVENPKITIPAGFGIVNTTETQENLIQTIEGYEAYITSTNINNGLVIQDGAGNQFVWIPVTNISNMAVPQSEGSTDYRGVLYDWDSDSTGNTQYEWNPNEMITFKEPANLNTPTENEARILDWTPSLFQTEFNSMVNKVQTYGGFYVGRYETGGFNTEQAVVKAGEKNNSINNANGYTMYNKTKTLCTNTVTVEIIWGCQYDQMLKFAGCANNETIRMDYELLETGAVSEDCFKNIYGLCGSLSEWTQEYSDADFRTMRGGVAYVDTIVLTASCRSTQDSPLDTGVNMGSRASLYIK